MKDLPSSLQRSMTLDNGKEFAEHVTLIRHLGLEIYFAEPYASWQRGTNENTNGLLRQFFPKGIDFTRGETLHQLLLWTLHRSSDSKPFTPSSRREDTRSVSLGAIRSQQ